MQVMASATEAWCKRVRDNERRIARMIILVGVFGCGKTQMLRGAARWIKDICNTVWPGKWANTVSYVVISWPKFCFEVLDNKERGLYEDAVASDVIFIDDVGAEEDRFKSGASTRLLGDLLGDIESKFVFLTTNIPPDQWVEKWDGRVEDRLMRNMPVIVDGFDPETRCISYAQYQLEKK